MGKRCYTSLFKEILDEREDDRGSKTDKDVLSCSVAITNFNFLYQSDKSSLSLTLLDPAFFGSLKPRGGGRFAPTL